MDHQFLRWQAELTASGALWPAHRDRALLRLVDLSESPEKALPSPMARVMRAADESWSRSRPVVPARAVVLERWGNFAIQHGVARANFSAPFPQIDLVESATARRIFDSHEQEAGQPLVGSIGRQRIRAEIVHFFGNALFGDRPGINEQGAAGYQLIDWTIADERRPVAVLVGTLAGFGHRVSWANVRLPPVFGLGHTYVPSRRADIPDIGIISAMRDGDGTRLALGWHGAAPVVTTERRWLTRIVAAVSFVVGAPAHVPLFVGYDHRGRRVAACGSLFGARREFRGLPGQPISMTGAAWIVPFLYRLLVLLRDRPDVTELDLALHYYLDSYEDPPDAAYLKLVVVLEGLAQRVLHERGAAVGVVARDGRLSVVRDGTWWQAFAAQLKQSEEFARWRALVESKHDAITRALVPNAVPGRDWTSGVIDKLASKNLSAAQELSAGQRVLAALLALGAKPDQRMRDECRDWHGARHTGVAPGGRDDVEERLVLLRSMLILLLARWAGYGGPILGHVRERTSDGRPGAVPDLPAAIFGSGVDEDQRREGLVRYAG